MKNNIQRESNGHLYWLDLIRFIAAFAVMACHFRGAFFVEYSALSESQQNPLVFAFYFITRLGFEAVLIFFVLSGLLVGGRAIKRISNGTFQIKSYAVDRSVRILLPLISSLLLFLPIALYFHLPLKISDWIGSLLSLQGIITDGAFETLWSLSYEVWFYIFTCGIGIIIMKKRSCDSFKYNIGIWLSLIALLVFTKLWTTYLFVWLIGAVALWRLPKPNKSILILTAILSFGIIILLQIGSSSHFMSDNVASGDIFRKCLIVLFGFCFAMFLQHAIQIAPSPGSIALHINILGTKLAAFSYTLYLTHVPVLKMLREMGAPKSESVNIYSIGLYILWLIIALVIAYILYYIFERNTPAVKKYIKTLVSTKKS